MSLRARWDDAARLIGDNRDVLDARPGGENAEPAARSEEWSSFLLGLDDAALAEIEVKGHDARWPERTPPSLIALARRAHEVSTVPDIATSDHAERSGRRFETPRKYAQIEAFTRLVLPLAKKAMRVVDVGSGHGHLTRQIAERIALPVVGLERDKALAARARTLSAGDSPSFAVTDVLRDGLPITGGDCAIGLHACGELGDAMVQCVARTGASIALVGCCLQKRRDATRHPLCASTSPALASRLALPKRVLGLSNLSFGDHGVEASRVENLAGRERRLALHRLLSNECGALPFGAEIKGLNRRTAHRDLNDIVARAFALRRLRHPSLAAIAEAAEWARAHHARTRRLSLPRATLARALETFILLDRALCLEESALVVSFGVLFPPAVSARNLALVAWPP